MSLQRRPLKPQLNQYIGRPIVHLHYEEYMKAFSLRMRWRERSVLSPTIFRGRSRHVPNEMSELRNTNESALNGGILCLASVITIDQLLNG